MTFNCMTNEIRILGNKNIHKRIISYMREKKIKNMNFSMKRSDV